MERRLTPTLRPTAITWRSLFPTARYPATPPPLPTSIPELLRPSSGFAYLDPAAFAPVQPPVETCPSFRWQQYTLLRGMKRACQSELGISCYFRLAMAHRIRLAVLDCPQEIQMNSTEWGTAREYLTGSLIRYTWTTAACFTTFASLLPANVMSCIPNPTPVFFSKAVGGSPPARIQTSAFGTVLLLPLALRTS